jgi:hypothetical protein
MIIESVVVGLAVVGTCSAYRCVHQKVACWLKPHRRNEAERQPASIDPTPSFTVELVRTVLEHQARREVQSRREFAFLISQLAAVVNPSENTPTPFFETVNAVLPDGNGVPKSNTGNRTSWAIQKLLPLGKR